MEKTSVFLLMHWLCNAVDVIW